ncbi:MAG TPA: hypothetical protein VFH47_05755, partial [Candidatus Thermoplasmatota archaeon]|nr:hypothetical protein [Candidatus Thermoplasmatota archaeon]
MDLLRLWSYPLLPQVRAVVAELGTTPLEVLRAASYERARERAVARIEGALGDGIPEVAVREEQEALRELLSIPPARMAVVALADRTLLQRYARAEGRLLGERLRAEPAPQLVEEVASHLGLPLEPLDGEAAAGEAAWQLPLAAYLSAAPAEAAWKLVRRVVRQGRVPVTHADVARLCEEQMQRRIHAELAAVAPASLGEEE